MGATPYVDLSFEEMAIKKVNCNAVPMLAVDAHGKRFSQVAFAPLSSTNLPLHVPSF